MLSQAAHLPYDAEFSLHTATAGDAEDAFPVRHTMSSGNVVHISVSCDPVIGHAYSL